MEKKKFLVVDGNSILNRAFYGVRALSTRGGQPTNAIFGMINIVMRQWEAVSPSYAVMAFDLKAPTFRHRMYPEYKAGRRPTPEELLAQFPLAKECARALGFHIEEREGYEADDILGTAAALATDAGCECYLLTGDRDALQLIDDSVHVLLATNTETVDYTRDVFFQKYGIQPEQFVDVKALMGDASDHIPGVAGIGEKTALRLIADYGTLDGVYEALPMAALSPSVRTKLGNGRDSAYLSRTLATICRTVPFDADVPSAWQTEGMNRRAARELFLRLEFSAYLKRFDLVQEIGEPTEGEAESSASSASPESGTTHLAITSASQLPAEDVPMGIAVSLSSVEFFNPEDKTLYTLDWTALETQEQRDCLQTYLSSKKHLCAFDAKTLYHTLENHGILFRGCAFDVMLAAYVLSSGEGSYEAERLSVSYLGQPLAPEDSFARFACALQPILLEKLRESAQEEVFFNIEMPLCAVLTDMEREGFHICCDGIAAYGMELDKLTQMLASQIYARAGREFNINSPKQLGEVLFGEEGLHLPSAKKSKTGYSTNAEVLQKLRPYHPIIADILDYRQVTKLKNTYVDGLLRVVGEDGQVHTVFKQTGTATGRLSSAEPNLQNIPIRTDLGRELRRYFTPRRPGYVLVDADYSQIELRLLAAISDDDTMKQAFISGADIHTSTASTVFGVAADQVTLEMRKRAKAINFGIVYGMGDFSLSEDLHISRREAKEYIDHYLATFPRVGAYLENIKKSAAEQGYVTTLFGRRRYIAELSSPNKMVRHFGERVAMNSPIQGTAADIIKLAMIAVHRRLREEKLDAKLILQVHDELLLEANEACADRALALLREEMENAVHLSVPLNVSVAVGANWYDAK